MSCLIVIAAVARNGVIGGDNRMLWHLPADMKHFAHTTRGSPVIMGRKTWDSLPERFRPLPGRRNLVVTRQARWAEAGAEAAASLDDALDKARDAERVYVIGGAALYAQALPRADELELTEIDADFDGDARFPPWPRERFAEVRRECHRAGPPNDFDFCFVTYHRND